MNIEVEEFCIWLGTAEIKNLEDIFNIINRDEDRQQLTRYFQQEGKIEALYEEFMEKISETDMEIKFIENLVTLYPLSKKVIGFFNKNMVKVDKKGIPSFFQSSKYPEGYFNKLLSEMEYLKKEADSSAAIEKIEDKIKDLNKDIKKFKEKIEYLKSLDKGENSQKIKERDDLKEEFKKLEKEQNIEKLEEEIEELKEKQKKLSEKYNKSLERKKELQKELNKIDLSKVENKELEAIKTLKNIWPKDEA